MFMIFFYLTWECNQKSYSDKYTLSYNSVASSWLSNNTVFSWLKICECLLIIKWFPSRNTNTNHHAHHKSLFCKAQGNKHWFCCSNKHIYLLLLSLVVSSQALVSYWIPDWHLYSKIKSNSHPSQIQLNSCHIPTILFADDIEIYDDDFKKCLCRSLKHLSRVLSQQK